MCNRGQFGVSVGSLSTTRTMIYYVLATLDDIERTKSVDNSGMTCYLSQEGSQQTNTQIRQQLRTGLKDTTTRARRSMDG
jgi:hypothetical protein